MENQTLGQKRVQRNFNPTANPQVEDLKEAYAKLPETKETVEKLHSHKQKPKQVVCMLLKHYSSKNI